MNPNGNPATLKPFKPGQSGNPAGYQNEAKRAAGKAAWKALLADFEANGVEAIERMREANPTAYVQLAASGLPAEKSLDLNINRRETLSEEQSRLMAETILEQHRRRMLASPVEPARVHDSAEA